MSSKVSVLSLGPVAQRFGVKVWQVRRLFLRNLVPEPGRIGPYRVIPEQDLPLIEQALRKAGYLPGENANAG